MNTAKNVIPISRDNSPMTTNLPEPLTPSDCDLTDWPFMQIDVARLRDSKFAATVDPSAGFFAVLLWAASWHRIPAGSLPDDDRLLAQMVGLGRDVTTWLQHKKDALYGWNKHNDGRYYHPFIAEKVLEAWTKKIFQRIRSGRANAKRWGCEFSEEKDLLAKHNAAWSALKHLNPTSRVILEGNPFENQSSYVEYPTGTPAWTPQGIPEQSQGKEREGKVRKGKVSNSSSSSTAGAQPPAAVPASPAAAAVSSIDDLELTPELIAWGKQNGIAALAERLAHFKAKCTGKNYRLDNPAATFMQACSEDWAKLNGKAGLQGGGASASGGATAVSVIDPQAAKRHRLAEIQAEIKGIDDLFKMAGITIDPTSQQRRDRLTTELKTLKTELANTEGATQ